ncbi:MAG: glycosyltransferase [Candidatus Harrisonbacteria bacterium]|nr:glycosyltransferase [Candidatus Harrisonbacteria bacterium]
MRLLILTQSIDENDPILGFFCRWLSHFAKEAETISVIGLGVGQYSLPDNIKVYSLGKERRRSRLLYLWNFFKLIFRLRKEYDAVFVHMNQEYVLLGGWLWKFWKKKIFLWRNHPGGNSLTRLAVKLSDRVFCTADKSFTAQFEKTELMPAGIDTDFFRANSALERKDNSLMYVGRISPIKHIDIFIKALLLLDVKGEKFRASIIGDPSPGQENYYRSLQKLGQSLVEKGTLSFQKGCRQAELADIYSAQEICVNATEGGSFDKTVLEAMSSECISLFSNKSFSSLLSYEQIELLQFHPLDAEDLAGKIGTLFALPAAQKKRLRAEIRSIVIEKQSLANLSQLLMQRFRS